MLQDDYFLRYFGIFEQATLLPDIFQISTENLWWSFFAKTVTPKSSIVDIWQGSKYASALIMNFSTVFFISALSWVNDDKLKKLTRQHMINHCKGALFFLPLPWPQKSILRQSPFSAFLLGLLLQMLSTPTKITERHELFWWVSM